MSNPGGMLKNEYNIYGLVNPPPQPELDHLSGPHQDISSGAVRWDNFVDLSTNHYYLSSEFNDLSTNFTDLSNNGFSFVQNSPLFSSMIETVPYANQDPNVSGLNPNNNIWYPLYQNCQVTFTQTKTFSKIRLWLKNRTGSITGLSNNLKIQLPNSNMINNQDLSANWAGADISGQPGIGNRDGWFNAIFPNGSAGPPGPIGSDTGIVEAQTTINNGGYDVYDISGPTKVGDLSNTGQNYELYKDIDINGWNLAWNVIITETDPSGVINVLNSKCNWVQGNIYNGLMFYYNPQAHGVIKGMKHNPPPMVPPYYFMSPPLTKNKATLDMSSNYSDVKDAGWWNSPTFTKYGHLCHSMRSKLQGNNLFYVEKDLGEQLLIPTGIPGISGGLHPWNNTPVIFKKDHSYLANVQMINTVITIPKTTGSIGPGLCNLDAITYLELIV